MSRWSDRTAPIHPALRRWLPIAGAGWVALMVIAGGWMIASLRRSIASELRGTLAANLITAETSTRDYFDRLITLADRLAPHADQAMSRSGAIESFDNFDGFDGFNSFDDFNAFDGVLGWCIVEASGRVTSSSETELIGTTVSIPDAAAKKLDRRQSTVSTPVVLSAAFEQPLMMAASPLHDGGRRTGAVVLLVDPAMRWSKILSMTRWADTGHTFALDRGARMIVGNRFPLDSTGHVSLIDSGTAKPALTLMADQVVRGGTGTNVDGYAGHRGVDVIGAWTWIHDFEIGLASEIDAAEAYAPLARIGRWLIVLAGLASLPLLTPAVVWWIDKRSAATPRHDPSIRQIGPYQLGETIGRGGMGTVYRGTHGVLRRTVAIKVLEGDSVSPQSIARFEREAQMTAQLRHPNTIDLYDFGRTDQDAFFYVMEYIDGITMQDLVDDYGAQPPARVIHLLLQVCGSLSEAHHHGLVHRDIKPANLMITSYPGANDLVKVLDFGLVKHVIRDSASRDLQSELTTSEGITGTPMYMSPETVRDAAMSDAASDIYSLGGVGYTLLTGIPMFDGDASADICMKQLKQAPLRPSERLGRPLPMDLQNVLMSCLRKDPNERPRSIDDLAAALRQCDDAGGWTDIDALRWWHGLQDDKAAGKNPAATATKAGGLSTAT